MNIVDLSLQIATLAHAGQTDRDGEAYILHPLFVGLMGNTDEERCAGFLHDVIEDCGITAEELVDKGIPMSVVNALQLLTHKKEIAYMDYVQGIIDSRNPIALKVKYNDLKHNYARGKAYPDLQAKHGPALQLIEKVVESRSKVEEYNKKSDEVEIAVFAAGCFWGVEHYMSKQKGVVRAISGYSGGDEDFPTYDEVRRHKVNHLESVLVEFQPDKVSYEELCKLFFEIHDPAQTDGQGPDKGSQYLSAVFYTDDIQKQTVEHLADILQSKGYEVNSRIELLGKFWIAEEYHQQYYYKTGGSPYCHFRQRKF